MLRFGGRVRSLLVLLILMSMLLSVFILLPSLQEKEPEVPPVTSDGVDVYVPMFGMPDLPTFEGRRHTRYVDSKPPTGSEAETNPPALAPARKNQQMLRLLLHP